MGQTLISYADKSNNVAIVDRTKQAAAEDFNELKTVVNNNANDVDDRFKLAVVNLVANTDYTWTNPHTATGAIPRLIQVKASDGTVILDAYMSVNQSTGLVTIQVGANYSNAILTSIGW